MAWLYLIIGGFFETLFAFSLGKISASSGREMYLWFLSFVVTVSLSMFFLYKAINMGLGIGLSYAVWGAIGAGGAVIAGILLMNEPVSFWKIFFLTTLILSVVGLNLNSTPSP
ncbi:MAG: SMR family transporter [Acidobacteriota bacterium]|jgi:quaternary ammonium compound-resistance protein SugE|nr:SMR family transporter [Acidobacteriota bacterium]NLT32384.1 QacE family quaternary ammonium compound efflux SMR transporter [Acidobacteriota bacterium]